MPMLIHHHLIIYDLLFNFYQDNVTKEVNTHLKGQQVVPGIDRADQMVLTSDELIPLLVGTFEISWNL